MESEGSGYSVSPPNLLGHQGMVCKDRPERAVEICVLVEGKKTCPPSLGCARAPTAKGTAPAAGLRLVCWRFQRAVLEGEVGVRLGGDIPARARPSANLITCCCKHLLCPVHVKQPPQSNWAQPALRSGVGVGADCTYTWLGCCFICGWKVAGMVGRGVWK